MRVYPASILLFVFAIFSISLKAQNGEGLTQDAKGRYSFSHTSRATEASKDVLYERLKSFVTIDLNASDTYIDWDETGHDSIKTVAFFELENSPEMRNQVIDCRARLDFAAGAVTLRLTGFNYSGTVISSGMPYARALYRMDPIPYSAQSWARAALEITLRQITGRMDELAAGTSVKPKAAPKAKRSGKRR